jgi:hypothetical protein
LYFYLTLLPLIVMEGAVVQMFEKYFSVLEGAAGKRTAQCVPGFLRPIDTNALAREFQAGQRVNGRLPPDAYENPPPTLIIP